MSNAGACVDSATQHDPNRWIALWLISVAALAVTLDEAVLAIIAPAVTQDLSADAAAIDLFSLISMLLAAFILGSGTLGDISPADPLSTSQAYTIGNVDRRGTQEDTRFPKAR